MKAAPAGSQQVQHYLYDASGTILTGGTPQLVLARSMQRSMLRIQNLSPGPLYYEIGAARAVATIAGGVVTAVSISSPVGATNAGFGYTKPPLVRFLGGGQQMQGGAIGPYVNTSYQGLNQPNSPNPARTAQGHAVLTGGAVSSIVIDDPGSGYVVAPFVFITNSDLDPFGCAVPTTTYSMVLQAGQMEKWEGMVCPTDPVAILGATTGQAFAVKWTD